MNPQAWFATHKPVALGGAAALVVAFALYQKRKAAAAANAPAAGTAGTSGTWAQTGTAGLTGNDPGTTATDLQNAVQDQINTALGQFQANINDQLAGLGATTAPPGTNGAITHPILPGGRVGGQPFQGWSGPIYPGRAVPQAAPVIAAPPMTVRRPIVKPT
jgi:hypothetical protein